LIATVRQSISDASSNGLLRKPIAPPSNARLRWLVEPLLIVRRVLREQIAVLHRRLLTIVRDDEVCRRLMTIPGVGSVVALTYRATVDVPARFRESKSVGAVFGLTCSKYQSGEIDRSGRISRCGDDMMRVMLYEAAQSMLRSKTLRSA
jgi:transposase